MFKVRKVITLNKKDLKMFIRSFLIYIIRLVSCKSLDYLPQCREMPSELYQTNFHRPAASTEKEHPNSIPML